MTLLNGSSAARRIFASMLTGFTVFAGASGLSKAADPVQKTVAPVSDGFFGFLQGEFTASVGARAFFEPVFVGGRRYEIAGTPTLGFNKKGTPDTFSSPHDDPGFAIFETSFVRFGPVMGFQSPRLRSDDNALRGLRKVNLALEPGVFAEIFPTDYTRIRAEFRQGVTGHFGQYFDLSADAYTKFAERWLFAVGPRISIVSSRALKPYFDVDAVQSLNSGLPQYRSGGGVRAVGAGSVLRYAWSKQVETEIYGEYERLVGSSGNSPLVKQRGNANQFVAGVGLTYKFDFVSPFGR